MEGCPSSSVDTVSKPTMESVIHSMHASSRSIEEYQDRFIAEGFSQKDGVDLAETLTLITKGLSQREGIDLVQVFSWIVGGFEVHGWDTHGCMGYCMHHEFGISASMSFYSSWGFPSLLQILSFYSNSTFPSLV
jgi:hypothetical protein